MPATAAPPTAESLLDALPPDRRAVMDAARRLVLGTLPAGYEEQVSGKMLVYVVPLTRYPKTYNKQPLMYAALAVQKHYTALHLPSAYLDPARREVLDAEFARAGKRLDMGKGCLRFRTMDDLATDAVATALAATPPDAFIALYEQSRAGR